MFGAKCSCSSFKAACKSWSAGTARSFSIAAEPNAASAHFALVCSVSTCGLSGIVGPKNAPLSPIARWNRPLESEDAMSALTESDPADSPKIVTLSGSPPNLAMLS